jgi:glyoxylase-like metal-dependent hydrolase (beta-lactamase superfamily II)/rhodanese-related sulfurtransferase
MEQSPVITTDELVKMLSSGKTVNIVDVRSAEDRAEWYIPGSIYADVYDRLRQHDSRALDAIHLDKFIPIVTVCSSGKTSLIAADLFRQQGYKAFSLKDGMKGWSLAWNTAHEEFEGFEIWQIRRTGKGCLSYVIASNEEAVVIDASLPIDVYKSLISRHHFSVKSVLETHIHADHLSRSRELSNYFNAPLWLPANDKVEFNFKPIDYTTVFQVGKINIQAIATPGHTTESFSFLVDSRILLTGDTLFTNAIGRPDLKSSPEETKEKARMLYHSLQELLSYPDSVIVLPAHTGVPVEFDNKIIQTTIGEAKKNIAILHLDENAFINSILEKTPATPPNFLTIIEKNIIGDYTGVNAPDLEAGANRCAIS